ncbi:hypothetical protein PS2_003139 [Malus domestica]
MNRSVLTVGPAMDMPIMHDSDRYELVRDIGSGNFGVARLMRDKQTGELVAVKYIERGEKDYGVYVYFEWEFVEVDYLFFPTEVS